MTKSCFLILLILGLASANFNCISSGFCPAGSCLFLVQPTKNGTCPDSIPMVSTKAKEDENPCQSGLTEDLKKCGLCVEFGPNGARKTKFNVHFTETCSVKCVDGYPNCKFDSKTLERSLAQFETPEDRFFKKLWRRVKRGVKRAWGGIRRFSGRVARVASRASGVVSRVQRYLGYATRYGSWLAMLG